MSGGHTQTRWPTSVLGSEQQISFQNCKGFLESSQQNVGICDDICLTLGNSVNVYSQQLLKAERSYALTQCSGGSRHWRTWCPHFPGPGPPHNNSPGATIFLTKSHVHLNKPTSRARRVLMMNWPFRNIVVVHSLKECVKIEIKNCTVRGSSAAEQKQKFEQFLSLCENDWGHVSAHMHCGHYISANLTSRQCFLWRRMLKSFIAIWQQELTCVWKVCLMVQAWLQIAVNSVR